LASKRDYQIQKQVLMVFLERKKIRMEKKKKEKRLGLLIRNRKDDDSIGDQLLSYEDS